MHLSIHLGVGFKSTVFIASCRLDITGGALLLRQRSSVRAQVEIARNIHAADPPTGEERAGIACNDVVRQKERHIAAHVAPADRLRWRMSHDNEFRSFIVIEKFLTNPEQIVRCLFCSRGMHARMDEEDALPAVLRAEIERARLDKSDQRLALLCGKRGKLPVS